MSFVKRAAGGAAQGAGGVVGRALADRVAPKFFGTDEILSIDAADVRLRRQRVEIRDLRKWKPVVGALGVLSGLATVVGIAQGGRKRT